MLKIWSLAICVTAAGVAPGCSTEGGSESIPLKQRVEGEGGGTCADVLFETFDACLAEAGVPVDDDTPEGQEIVAACWIDVANGAFDECCAATPDETCTDVEDAPGGCSDVLFTSFDECLLGLGIDPQGGLDGDGNFETEEEQEAIAYCWIEVANAAFDVCCEQTPDESCDEGEDPGEDPGEGGGTCADVLFAADAACLAEAGSVDGDLDGSGEIDTDEEIALISYCWIDVANAAFDQCCEASPDSTCDEGTDCGDDSHDEGDQETD